MTSVRPGMPGATRACPHCRETILESSTRCPACKHYLRVDAGGEAPPAPAITPLRIEGGIRHPADADPWEYTVVVTIRNGRGEEIARKLIGVGVLDARDQCTFALTLEAVAAKGKRPGKGNTRH